MGRVNWTDQCLPSGCGTTAYDKFMSYGYDHAGDVSSFTDSANITTSYQYSPAAEVLGIQTTMSGPAFPSSLISSVQNSPFGPVSYQMGNGLAQANVYDSLGRLSGGWPCIGRT